MIKNIFFLTLLVSNLIGCTIIDGNSIVTGNARSSLSYNEVRIYRVAPAEFEEIAMVSSSAGHDFKKNSSLMNSAIHRIKEEAAILGANGVILTQIDERDSPSVITSYGSATAVSGGSTGYATGITSSVNRGDAYTRLRGIA